MVRAARCGTLSVIVIDALAATIAPVGGTPATTAARAQAGLPFSAIPFSQPPLAGVRSGAHGVLQRSWLLLMTTTTTTLGFDDDDAPAAAIVVDTLSSACELLATGSKLSPSNLHMDTAAHTSAFCHRIVLFSRQLMADSTAP